MNRLQSIISPKTIAVVGASEKLHKNAGRVVVNLHKSSFSGEIYMVNPKYEHISGIPCYSSLVEIDEDIDLVCVIVPSKYTPKILKDCVKKNVKSVIIISSGFSEYGPQGKELETELKEIIKGTDVKVYGPNSPGFFHYIDNWGISFSPRFEPKKFQKGSVGLISHGGSLGRAVVDANEKGVGFSYWLSPGNEMNININDCFEFLIEDPSTKSIVLIIESNPEEERFFRLIHQAFLKRKPVILLSLGHYKTSRAAIKYHLGRQTDYSIPWNKVEHPGLIKVGSVDELVSLAWLFDTYQGKKGKRTAIFSWAGATSIYLADLCEKYGIHLPPLSLGLQQKLKDIIGLDKTLINPLDITTVVYDDLSKLTRCLDVMHQSGEYDNIIVPFPFQVDYQNEILSTYIKSLISRNGSIYIPIFMSQGYQEEIAVEILKQTKKPYFFNEKTAMKAFATYLNYTAYRTQKEDENEEAIESDRRTKVYP